MDNFLGTPYPIVKSPQGYLGHQSGINQIKADLLILLLTNPGEAYCQPGYGTGLRDLMFEVNNTALQSRARTLIINAIQTWEPRISVQQITVSSTINTNLLNVNDNLNQVNNILSINIQFFDPNNIQSVQELDLQVPLGGSS